MANKTVKITNSKHPGKHEYKEEIEIETDDRAEVEPMYEVKREVQQEPGMSDPSWRVAHAEAIIRRNVLWALGLGVIPIPFVDMVAITSVQVKMLKELSELYGTKFTTKVARKIIASLLVGIGSVGLGVVVGGSLAKLIPALGTTLGVVTVPVLAGALTYATGRIFLRHFESGGSVHDFDSRKMRSQFKREFEDAKETVTRMQAEEESKSTSAKSS